MCVYVCVPACVYVCCTRCLNFKAGFVVIRLMCVVVSLQVQLASSCSLTSCQLRFVVAAAVVEWRGEGKGANSF